MLEPTLQDVMTMGTVVVCIMAGKDIPGRYIPRDAPIIIVSFLVITGIIGMMMTGKIIVIGRKIVGKRKKIAVKSIASEWKIDVKTNGTDGKTDGTDGETGTMIDRRA